MGKTNFQTLEELTKSLQDNVSKLASGHLSIDEIEHLTQEAQALYERLIIIRYKSYENRGEEQVVEPEEFNDFVAEPTVSETPVETPAADEGMMMFDFSTPEEPTIEEEEVVDTVPETPVADEPVEIEVDTVVPAENPLHEQEEEDSSLNANFKSEDSSLASKFTKAPISDLKSHIGINRKFLYINDLFNGSGESYETAIHKLNTCETRTDAFLYLEELMVNENWDVSHQSVISFTDIVERRYLEE